MVTIRRYDVAHEAHLDKGLLAARGIPAEVHGEHHGSIEWGPAEISGIVLQVPPELAERASTILKDRDR